jgi:SAM-dependent methyltransferase
MKVKRDWGTYLHEIRRREFELIFGRFPRPVFNHALEIGAGDGFQSGLLTEYAERLTVTDYYEPPAIDSVNQTVTSIVCDADALAERFAPKTFDLVFSSSLLEHLPNPEATLRGVQTVLADHGLVINVVPNPTWKILQLVLHFPNLVAVQLEKGLIHRETDASVVASVRDLNPKTSRRHRRWRHFLPEPHGVCETNRAELSAFSRDRWLAVHEKAGLAVIAVLPGPFCSGYGFGAGRARTAFERLGLSSENVFVSVKKECRSPFERYFRGR